MFLSKFSLKTKMIGAFLGIATLLLVVGALNWISNKTSSHLYEEIAGVNLPNIAALGQMRFQAQEANRLTLRAILAKTPQEIAGYKNEFDASLKAYADLTRKFLEGEFFPGEEPLFKESEEDWKTFSSKASEIFRLVGDPSQAAAVDKALHTELGKLRSEHNESLNKLLVFNEERVSSDRLEAEKATEAGEIEIAVVIALGFILAAATGFIFATVLSKTLNQVSDDLMGSAQQTSSAGTELSAASQQLSEGSSEAASSLEQTVASLEELSSIVKINADNASEANTLSLASSESAQEGEKEIAHLIRAMEEMASGSKKIEDIITVIDDIAFQTNLLALNASVEAARAGEQGKGFAIVAEAVRTLAQKSADAAKDINQLILENAQRSQAGAKIAGQSGVALKKIVSSIQKIAQLNGEISSASRSQAEGIEQISKAMNQLDQATQLNAASSEEVAASSEEMANQAEILANLVRRLRQIIQGSRTQEGSPNPSI